jgi:hypothetical protein
MQRFLVGFACLFGLIWLILFTWHWPLMGDATYIHYVLFLTNHGMAPYRDILELNMPCSYLIERAVLAVYGKSAIGWRLFDFTLLAMPFLSLLVILRPKNWQAGVLAATLFATVHAQDGVMMAGERDLQVAALQIVALACLVYGLMTSEPNRRFLTWSCFFAFGMLASLAACIKPPAILFLLACLCWMIFRPKLHHSSVCSFTLSTALGAAVPVCVTLVYLAAYHAVFDFWKALRGLIAYHTQLERKPLSFLLPHSFSPILILFVLYLILLLLRKRQAETSHISDSLLAISAISGWLTYAIQGKGFSYQRYPFLIFLLPLISSTIFSADNLSDAARWAARTSIVASVALIMTFSYRAGTFSKSNPYKQMSDDLQELGGEHLSGSVQCMDTAGGCIATLYENQLVQSNGLFYDCYLLDGRNAVVRDMRRRFEDEMASNPPKVLIITDSVCYGGKRSFNKFSAWPTFTSMLAQHYSLVTQRYFTSPVRYWTRGDVPYDYRIYVRK